jgi:mono/diheme cytochrome c family protein
MCMRNLFLPLLAVLAAFPAMAESPGLGEPVDQERLATLDYTILPNGDGLPAGSGTAVEGSTVYRQNCLACHGESGSGGINDVLAGGQGSLASDKPLKTIGSYWPYATTVFDYVRRAMPLPNPGVLTDDEIYAVTAYLLYLNGVVGEGEVMNAESLPGVQMPNRDGFVRDWTEE